MAGMRTTLAPTKKPDNPSTSSARKHAAASRSVAPLALAPLDRATYLTAAPSGPSTQVQAKCTACEAEDDQGVAEPVQLWDCSEYVAPTCVQSQEAPSAPPVQTKCAACTAEEEHVQQKGGPPTRDARMIQREAGRGLQGASATLPHADRIQAAFGRHDVSHVLVSVGGAAAKASKRMGAMAFTSGDRIGFRESPDLRLAAHEAAHTVQQRSGLALPGNIGRAGDRWERHADRVAEAVMGGESAEALLDEVAGPSHEPPAPEQAPAVQRQMTTLAIRSFEPPSKPTRTPSSAACGVATARSQGGGAEKGPTDEGKPAAEAAEEGQTEAPPIGAGGAAATAAASPTAEGQGKPPAGGGLSTLCYSAGTEVPPDNTPKPKSDNKPGKSEAKPVVTRPAWTEDTTPCPAEKAVAEGAQQMPGGVGQGAPLASAANGATAPGTNAGKAGEGEGAPSAEGEAPAADVSAKGGEASESGEVRAMSQAADAEAAESTSAARAMDTSISSAVTARDAAVAEFATSRAGLGDVLARAGRLQQGVSFAGEGAREKEQASRALVRSFMANQASRIAAVVSFAREQAPDTLRGRAETVKVNIEAAKEVEKGAISRRIAAARSAAVAGAVAVRAHVRAAHDASVAQIEAETSKAIAALETTYTTSSGQVDTKETTGLADVNTRFANGRKQHEDKGPEYAKKATSQAQKHVAGYEKCKHGYKDDGFWDGCLTVRRAKAQQDAACKTAQGYKDTFLELANDKAYNLKDVRTQYRCAVIAGARQVHKTLDDTYDKLIDGLKSGRAQAIAGLAVACKQNTAAIDSALAATLESLDAQEEAQRQAVNDSAYMQQLTVEQLAHTAATNLARGISAAMDSLDRSLGELRDRIATGRAPEPDAIASTLATVESTLGGGMGLLLSTMSEGASQAEGKILQSGDNALAALLQITTKNDEVAGQVEGSFAEQMRGMMSGATSTFRKLTSGQVQQAKRASTEGTASMKSVVTGFETSLQTIGTNVDKAIASSLSDLEGTLGKKLLELDAQIASEAWKAAEKEQPAWKSVVAIVLIIVVIIAATVISIVTLGAGASLFAVILVGALVGAVSAGLIQLINNWASGEAWHQGLAQAMIMGAIGGAIGGGLGFAAGSISAAAGPIMQRVITIGADLIAEGIQQTIGYLAFGQKFNWQGFVMAGAMSSISFVPRPRAGAHAPAPTGGARRAATQIAGGALVGLGVEYVGAKISGEKFDLTRAASSAASGAAAARASRLGGHGGAPKKEPTTRYGRAMKRFRSFDPGGVGARFEESLGKFGQRAFGPKSEAELPTAGRTPMSEETAVTKPHEATTKPREEPTTTTKPNEEPTATTKSQEETTVTKSHDVAERTPDLPLAAPGAMKKIEIGERSHTISAKRTSSGEVVITSCSNCAILRDRLKALADSLTEGPAKTRATELKEEAAKLQQQINDNKVDDIAGEVHALANRVSKAAATHQELAWSLRNLLEGVDVRPLAPKAPEPGGRIDSNTPKEFAERTGGIKGWFEEANALSAVAKANPALTLETATQWYETAKTTLKVPALGDFAHVTRAVKAREKLRSMNTENPPPELYQLNAPKEKWQLQVNDAWILGHVERGSTFEIVSNPTAKSNIETRLSADNNPMNRTGDRVQSVFGRELQVLELHGYRFVQDKGPKNPESTHGISGRMVPPSEVAKLAAKGYVWIKYKTPTGQFQGITGRWVKTTDNSKWSNHGS